MNNKQQQNDAILKASQTGSNEVIKFLNDQALKYAQRRLNFLHNVTEFNIGDKFRANDTEEINITINKVKNDNIHFTEITEGEEKVYHGCEECGEVEYRQYKNTLNKVLPKNELLNYLSKLDNITKV